VRYAVADGHDDVQVRGRRIFGKLATDRVRERFVPWLPIGRRAVDRRVFGRVELESAENLRAAMSVGANDRVDGGV